MHWLRKRPPRVCTCVTPALNPRSTAVCDLILLTCTPFLGSWGSLRGTQRSSRRRSHLAAVAAGPAVGQPPRVKRPTGWSGGAGVHWQPLKWSGSVGDRYLLARNTTCPSQDIKLAAMADHVWKVEFKSIRDILGSQLQRFCSLLMLTLWSGMSQGASL